MPRLTGTKGTQRVNPTITPDAVENYRREKRAARVRGAETLEDARGQASDPVAQANAVLAHAKAQGYSDKQLQDLQRHLLASMAKAAGIEVVSFPKAEGVPPGFRAMDVRVIIPNEPQIGVQSGKETFINANAKGVYKGKPFTMIMSVSEYAPREGTEDEKRRRKEAAVAGALFEIPANGTVKHRRASDVEEEELEEAEE